MTMPAEQFVNKFIHHDGIYPRNKLLNYKHKSLQIAFTNKSLQSVTFKRT